MAELSEAWANIYAQYIERNQGNESKYIYQLQADIVLLHDETMRVEAGVEILKQMKLFDQEEIDVVATTLRKRGYDYPFNVDDPEVFDNNLMMCTNRIANRKFKLQAKEKELTDYLASRKNDTIDETYFDRWMTRLSRFMHLRLRKPDTTVDEFLLMLQEYLDDVKAKQSEIDAVRKPR